MTDQYEFEISGTIGPLIQSCLLGFNAVAESDWTVLTGTADGPDDLRRVLDLLDAHGKPALDVRITHWRDEPATSSGDPVGPGRTHGRPGQ